MFSFLSRRSEEQQSAVWSNVCVIANLALGASKKIGNAVVKHKMKMLKGFTVNISVLTGRYIGEEN